MSSSSDKPVDTKRAQGRELACEAILRSRFGEQPVNAGIRALEQLRQGQDAPRAVRPFRWRVFAAAAVAILAASFGAFMIQRALKPRPPLQVEGYPAPVATGQFTVIGNGPVARGTSLATSDEAANLVLGGYCSITMLPNTAARIDGAEKVEAITLTKGKVSCSVDRNVGQFRVETDLGTVKTATAKAVGAEFEVQLLEKGETTKNTGTEADAPHPDHRRIFVNVIAGSVLLTTPAGDKVLQIGEHAILPPIPKVKTVEKLIAVSIGCPNPSWKIKIDEIRQVKNEVWVVSTLSSPTGVGMSMISSTRDTVNVEVPDLPIKHFIIGRTWNWGGKAGYKFIKSRQEIEKELKTGKLFYQRPN